MGRKKTDKRKKKHPARKPPQVPPETTVAHPSQPDQPALGHLSREWRDFYRLVMDRVRC